MKLQILAKLFVTIVGVTLFSGPSAFGQKPETKILFHGHAAFEIHTPKGIVLMIDPWLRNPKNPAAQDQKNPVEAVKKLDYILITHGHFDHVGDAVELAKKTGAKLVTNFELGSNLTSSLGFPEKQAGYDTLMNIGGEIVLQDGELTIAMVPAVHSSSLPVEKPTKGQPKFFYAGNPGGFVLKIKNGPTIYHTGDTAYFEDMKSIGKFHKPDIALINIGGHFGMSDEMAVEAAKAVQAKRIIPHHFGTLPVLTPDARNFTQLAKGKFRVDELKPGESLTITQ